jgi:hypothetical protein
MSTRITTSRATCALCRAALIVFVLAATTGRAWAQWKAHTGGADTYGEPTFVAVSAARSGDALLVLCDQTKLLALAYLIPGTPTELAEMSKPGAELPVTLLVRIDNGASIRFDAQLRRWNNKYIGAIAGGRTTELVEIVHKIEASTQAIRVGMDILGDQQTESFSSAGSAAAMNMAMKDCKLDPNPASTNGAVAGVSK